MNKYIKMNGTLSLFSKNYMDLKKDLPIRPSEMGVLNIITQVEGKYTFVDLANMLNVSKPMITAHIASLLEKGYIEKEQSLDDKRVFFISPTEKALQLVEKSKVNLSESLEKLIKEIGEKEFDYFVSIAEKANNLFAKERGKNEFKKIPKEIHEV